LRWVLFCSHAGRGSASASPGVNYRRRFSQPQDGSENSVKLPWPRTQTSAFLHNLITSARLLSHILDEFFFNLLITISLDGFPVSMLAQVRRAPGNSSLVVSGIILWPETPFCNERKTAFVTNLIATKKTVMTERLPGILLSPRPG